VELLRRHEPMNAEALIWLLWAALVAGLGVGVIAALIT
jgi:hypothetical protein